jgi:hypothetical protein
MAEEIIGLKVELDTSGASAPMASLKSQIKEATNELVNFTGKFGATSKEAINAAKRVAELKDRLGDARQMVDAFNPDAKFNSLTQAIQGAAGAFSAVQGAMGLFGVESANTEKALLKVQSAMALSQGLSSFLDGGIEGFKNLYRTISGPVVESFSTLKGALISTGIGALVVLIGLAIANFDKLSVAIGLTTEAEQALKSINADITKGMEQVYKNVNSVNDAMVKARAGTISKKEALKIYNETLGDSIGHTNNFNQAEKLLRDKTPAFLAAMQARITMQVAMAKIAELQAKIATNKGGDLGFVDSAFTNLLSLFGKTKDAANLTTSAIKDQNTEWTKQIGLYENLVNEQQKIVETKEKEAGINTNATTNATPEQKKKTAEKKQGKTDIEILKEKYASELLAAQEFHLSNIELEETYEKKKLAITEKYLKTKLASNAQTHVELLTAQKDIYAKLRELEINEIKKGEEDAPEKSPKVIAAKEEANLLLDTEGNYIKEKEAIDFRLILAAESEAKRRIANIELAKLEKEQKIQALEATANTLNGVAELLGKQTTAGKVAAVASATIETFLSAQRAYSATIGIPIVGPTLAPINAALAIATGVMNVKKILAVKTPDGGGGSSSSISGSTAPNAPSATVFNTTTKLNKDSIDKINDKAVKAYVVETDINNGQKRIERILINTKFK